MEATLNEKEFLMREVHHRIKNNLQMISSFLSLEATLFPAKNFDEIMQSCQSRIMSLSLIHDNLKYFPENENTDIKYYLDSVVEDLLNSQSNEKSFIEMNFENACFRNDRLFTLGLLVNEMISIGMQEKTDLKNGLQFQLTGKIMDSKYELIYDCPNPIHKTNFGEESLAIKLIKGFANQIDSELHIDLSKGIHIKNRIPIE